MNKDKIKESLREVLDESSSNPQKDLVTDEMRAAIDRMDDIGNCWQMITDLICPSQAGDSLNAVDRDKMACALDFLQKEYWQASEKAHLEMKRCSS